MFIIIFPVNFGNNFLQVGAPMLRVLRSDWPAELECKTRTPFVSNLDGAVPPNWNVSQHFIAENTISTCSSMLVLLSVFLSCIQQYSTPAKIKNNHKIGDLSQFNSPKLELSYVMGVTRFVIQADEPPVEGYKAAPLLKSVDEVHGISNANEDVPKKLAKKLEMGLSENEGYTMDIPWRKFFFWKIMSNQWI